MKQIPERFRLDNGDLDITRHYRVEEFRQSEKKKLLSLFSFPLNIPIIIGLLIYVVESYNINTSELIELISHQIHQLGIKE